MSLAGGPMLGDGMGAHPHQHPHAMQLFQAFEIYDASTMRAKRKKNKVYTCKICKREFRWSSNLRRHNGIHTGKKPYKCAHCGAGFNNSSNRWVCVCVWCLQARE